MSYTFWHCGILIGESELEGTANRPRQRGGVFRPTAYGVELFPRLTGILSAGHALKEYLDAHGLSEEEMEQDQIEEIFNATPAGRKIIDIGRTLSEVELRAPDGRSLEFESIAFSDLLELRALARELGPEKHEDAVDLPAGTPRYIVSATLSKGCGRDTEHRRR
jgi:hypothetical protein